jgi:hypothetical protein
MQFWGCHHLNLWVSSVLAFHYNSPAQREGFHFNPASLQQKLFNSAERHAMIKLCKQVVCLFCCIIDTYCKKESFKCIAKQMTNNGELHKALKLQRPPIAG